MRHEWRWLAAAALVAGFWCGCERSSRSDAVSAAHRQAGANGESARRTFIRDLERRTKALAAKIEELGDRAEEASGAAGAELQAAIDDLRARRADLQAKLDELRAAGSDVWADLKAGVERGLTELRNAYEQTRSYFEEGDG